MIKYRLVEHNCPGVGARAVPVAPGNVIESLENLDLNAGCTRLPFRKISEGFEDSNKLNYVLFFGATNLMSIDQFAGTNERFEQLIHFRENDRPFSCECKNETHYTNKGNMFVQNFKANVDENSRWNMNLLVLVVDSFGDRERIIKEKIHKNLFEREKAVMDRAFEEQNIVIVIQAIKHVFVFAKIGPKIYDLNPSATYTRKFATAHLLYKYAANKNFCKKTFGANYNTAKMGKFRRELGKLENEHPAFNCDQVSSWSQELKQLFDEATGFKHNCTWAENTGTKEPFPDNRGRNLLKQFGVQEHNIVQV